MQNVHPIMQQAMAGIAPPGVRSAPVLNTTLHWQQMNDTLRAALKSFDAPPCPRGQFAYTYRHPGLGALDCHLEGEEGDESVGWPERVTLCAAYLRGVDITDRLTADEVESIETAAMHPRNEYQEQA